MEILFVDLKFSKEILCGIFMKRVIIMLKWKKLNVRYVKFVDFGSEFFSFFQFYRMFVESYGRFIFVECGVQKHKKGAFSGKFKCC